jgi:hypothetical protein
MPISAVLLSVAMDFNMLGSDQPTAATSYDMLAAGELNPSTNDMLATAVASVVGLTAGPVNSSDMLAADDAAPPAPNAPEPVSIVKDKPGCSCVLCLCGGCSCGSTPIANPIVVEPTSIAVAAPVKTLDELVHPSPQAELPPVPPVPAPSLTYVTYDNPAVVPVSYGASCAATGTCGTTSGSVRRGPFKWFGRNR